MKLLFVIALVFSINTYACSDFNWKWSVGDWIDKSDKIYHGIVVSISLDESSIYDGETNPLFNAISLRGKKRIKLKVSETLKGEEELVVSAMLPECYGGVTEFGDSALLFKVNDVWHIKSLEGNWADDKAAQILTKLSKAKNVLGN